MSDMSTGLQQNVGGVLCYVLGWVSGLVMLILEPKNTFIRFHAFQSILSFGAIFVIIMIWIAMMLVASQNKMYKLPFVGDYAEKWANKA